jgi:hypothetical protein
MSKNGWSVKAVYIVWKNDSGNFTCPLHAIDDASWLMAGHSYYVCPATSLGEKEFISLIVESTNSRHAVKELQDGNVLVAG